MDVILSYVIYGSVIIFLSSERFRSPKFQLDRNLESYNLHCVMYGNLGNKVIKTNSLITQVCESSEGLKELVHNVVH